MILKAYLLLLRRVSELRVPGLLCTACWCAMSPSCVFLGCCSTTSFSTACWCAVSPSCVFLGYCTTTSFSEASSALLPSRVVAHASENNFTGYLT